MLDTKDHQILAELKKDGRASIKTISKATGIRPSTIHQRIQKLIDAKTIEQFTIKVNDEAVGEEFVAFLLIKGNTQKYLTPQFLSDSRVKEVYGVTGEYDVLVKLKSSDVKEFNDFLISFRNKHSDIQTTLSMVGTAKIKEEL